MDKVRNFSYQSHCQNNLQKSSQQGVKGPHDNVINFADSTSKNKCSISTKSLEKNIPSFASTSHASDNVPELCFDIDDSPKSSRQKRKHSYEPVNDYANKALKKSNANQPERSQLNTQPVDQMIPTRVKNQIFNALTCNFLKIPEQTIIQKLLTEHIFLPRCEYDKPNSIYRSFNDKLINKEIDYENVKLAIQTWIQEGNDVNQKIYMGNTALHIAFETKGIKLAQILIEAGANVNSPNKYGRTALNDAVQRRCIQLVQILIAAGADVNLSDKFGQTALHYAVQIKCIQLVPILIAAGADVNIRASVFNCSILNYSAIANNLKDVKLLINAGATFDITNFFDRRSLQDIAKRRDINQNYRKIYVQLLHLVIRSGCEYVINRSPSKTESITFQANGHFYKFPIDEKVIAEQVNNGSALVVGTKQAALKLKSINDKLNNWDEIKANLPPMIITELENDEVVMSTKNCVMLENFKEKLQKKTEN